MREVAAAQSVGRVEQSDTRITAKQLFVGIIQQTETYTQTLTGNKNSTSSGMRLLSDL
jgi:hypothetical protein